MDEALEIRRSAAPIDRHAIERKLHDVIRLDAVGRTRARQKITLRIVGMAHADVAERIHHTLARQNAICGDKLLDQIVQLGHENCPRAWFGCPSPFRSSRRSTAQPRAWSGRSSR